ncbi:MAG TPA: hypothetical protein PK095_16950, partial [Myxococcota bacterium]|nr:hypothetical protein [Myxococcota bacterium]
MASLPLALHYEVPDRGAPWAQAFTARLEAIARAARVPLVAEPHTDPTRPSTRAVQVRLSGRSAPLPTFVASLGELRLT